MKKKRKVFLLLALICISTLVLSQDRMYQYSREIKGITESWHKLKLPDELFGRLKKDLSDLRIIGTTQEGDSIEAPYIINIRKEQVTDQEVNFRLINASRANGDYYFTFEIPEIKTINEIELEFQQQNFDWRVSLAGSQNQIDWFDIVLDYRILSIKNELTDYHFTKIAFPPSNYRFYRIKVEGDGTPVLGKAFVRLKEITEGKINAYELKSFQVHEDKETRQTIVDVDLDQELPVSRIKLNIDDDHDYYRPITIQYLADSFETGKGWKYTYKTLVAGILTSIEDQEFGFRSTIMKKLHLLINNHDNEPLKIKSFEVSGYNYELIARFNQNAEYWLVYGSDEARNPRYDIAHFKGQIPEILSSVQLGDELAIPDNEVEKETGFFKNRAWLWGMLILIITILGYFSGKLIRKELSK